MIGSQSYPYLEVWSCKEGYRESKQIREGALQENEIIEWAERNDLRHTSDQSLATRVLFYPGFYNDTNASLSASSTQTLQHLANSWNIPSLFLRACHSPVSICYVTGDMKSQVDGSIPTLLLQHNHGGYWLFFLVMCHDTRAHVTNVLILGLAERYIEVLDMLIRTSHGWELNMSLIPIILVEQSLETINLTLSRTRTELSQVEKETGMHNYFIREEPSAPDESILNLENVTKRLTVLSAEFAHVDLVCNTQLHFLDKISEWEDKTSRALHAANSNYRRGLKPLSDRYEYARATLVSLLAHSEYSQKRTQSQVQTVYSLIGQRDNQLNFSVAEAQSRLTQLSLQDSKAMKKVAEDSHQVALLTQKDSADMRVIAAVTLIFLPGTFTATMFSSSFFNFQAGSPPIIVSRWIWLYWVITIALTIIVLAAWWFFARVQSVKKGKTSTDEPIFAPIISSQEIPRAETTENITRSHIGRSPSFINLPSRIDSYPLSVLSRGPS